MYVILASNLLLALKIIVNLNVYQEAFTFKYFFLNECVCGFKPRFIHTIEYLKKQYASLCFIPKRISFYYN